MGASWLGSSTSDLDWPAPAERVRFLARALLSRALAAGGAVACEMAGAALVSNRFTTAPGISFAGAVAVAALFPAVVFATEGLFVRRVLSFVSGKSPGLTCEGDGWVGVWAL